MQRKSQASAEQHELVGWNFLTVSEADGEVKVEWSHGNQIR